MALPIVRYFWDKNDVNTAPLSPDLQANGYPIAAIPTSAQFNQLFRTVSFLAYQAGATGEVRTTFDSDPIWSSFEGFTVWIKYVDGTIGNASSGGTVRANSDTVDLFTLLWNNTTDGDCPVSGGRGANAAADFAANKNIQLPLINGNTLINAANLSDYRLAESVGETTHSLTTDENGLHTHLTGEAILSPTGGTSGSAMRNNGSASFNTVSTPSGLGSPHNIMQPSTAIYFFIKL